MTHVVVLAGGFGGARFSHGVALAATASAALLELSVVVNTGDDLESHGLLVCPDLDTVLYTLAGLANDATGWGLRDETWSAAAMLERLGAATWFRLGDRDLATHLRRSDRLRDGARLTEVEAELAASLGVHARILPMSDERVRTELRTDAGWLEFQEYFVHRGHRDDVHEIRFAGIEKARPTPEVHAAIAGADVIVVAPSNPYVSIATILAVPGMTPALLAARAPIVAVSPIIAGAAVRGPADRMFTTLGGEASALGVARHYRERHPGLLDGLVIDTADAGQAGAIRKSGLAVQVTGTLMRDEADRRRLAEEILAFAMGLSG
ncbi:MAG: 2-phospho-L-lactate transferase [Candidatus Limnocylindrales bacterium]